MRLPYSNTNLPQPSYLRTQPKKHNKTKEKQRPGNTRHFHYTATQTCHSLPTYQHNPENTTKPIKGQETQDTFTIQQHKPATAFLPINTIQETQQNPSQARKHKALSLYSNAEPPQPSYPLLIEVMSLIDGTTPVMRSLSTPGLPR
ncbi:hypothetical protein E2C01_029418 [Portunus trituberculatus]|uniref:Uncharacterized protein n=1 Tax=Portunus trituberculatus TaxID=210409 RepID=A0A5B7ERS5_PORTR|nr:hypothetical protein [Portunus trituberculatus]